MPLPDPRPSETIAKLFPQTDPVKDQKKDQNNGTKPPEPPVAAGANDSAKPAEAARKGAPAAQPAAAVGQPSSARTAAANPVPLPEARPNIKSSGEGRRPRYSRHRRIR
jgi:membrane-bound lytic murein transglycosylase A